MAVIKKLGDRVDKEHNQFLRDSQRIEDRSAIATNGNAEGLASRGGMDFATLVSGTGGAATIKAHTELNGDWEDDVWGSILSSAPEVRNPPTLRWKTEIADSPAVWYIAEPFDPANHQSRPSHFRATAIHTESSVVPTQRLVPRRSIAEDDDFANQRGKRKQRVTAGRDDPDSTSRPFNVHMDAFPCHELTDAECTTQLSGEPVCVSTKLVPSTAQILPLETELQYLAIRRRREFESTTVDACTTHGAVKSDKSTAATYQWCSFSTSGTRGICPAPRDAHTSHTATRFVVYGRLE
jgi:hypothetical protein